MDKGGSVLKDNRGVSPVVATILLIGMVLVMVLIVFIWFKGFTQEAITKFDKNVDLVCGETRFEASYSNSNGILAVSNIGNVPIYNMKVKISAGGNYETKDINDLSANWKSSGLNPGRTFSGGISPYLSGADSITLVPVLIGSSKSGERAFTCDETKSGKKISL